MLPGQGWGSWHSIHLSVAPYRTKAREVKREEGAELDVTQEDCELESTSSLVTVITLNM